MASSNTAGSTKRQLIRKSSTTIVAAMAIAAIVVSITLVLLNFLWGLSRHNESVISEKQKASRILEENVENIEALQSSFRLLEAGDPDSTTILDALPSKYDFPALASTVESLALRSGLALASFTGDDLEQGALQQDTNPEPVEIPFSVVVQGDYSDVQKFVTNLEKTIRPMHIQAIELKGSDTNMKATLSIATFYQPAADLDVTTKAVQ